MVRQLQTRGIWVAEHDIIDMLIPLENALSGFTVSFLLLSPPLASANLVVVSWKKEMEAEFWIEAAEPEIPVEYSSRVVPEWSDFATNKAVFQKEFQKNEVFELEVSVEYVKSISGAVRSRNQRRSGI